MQKLLLTSLLLFCLLYPGYAKSDILGPGSNKCGIVLELEPEQRPVFIAWMQGWISAKNAFGPILQELSSNYKAKNINEGWEVLWHLALKKCRENPKQPFAHAILFLVSDFWNNRN